MTVKTKPDPNEVLGIIITHGKAVHVEPKLSFYMWCDEPGAEPDSSTKAA